MVPYQDPILPKAHPDLLQDAAYDPFALMPKELPAHPRVFLTPERLAVARDNLARHEWARLGLELLSTNCEPDEPPTPDPRRAFRNALAASLTDQDAPRQLALDCMRLAAPTIPAEADTPPAEWATHSSNAANFAMAYDLLVDGGLHDADERSFRQALTASRGNFDLCPHYACGNHNSHNLARIVAVALALGDRQMLHDTLYGWDSPRQWRYGLVHQLRHDILGDGLHWERTLGYHYYTLMALTNLVDMLGNVGIDLWHRELPSANKNDLQDLHFAYGPRGNKCFKAAFDAPLYAMFGNGDFSMVHDSGLYNIRGVWIWGLLYNLAYDAYGDPNYAWLLNRIEKEYGPDRERPGLPMPLQTHHADVDFARLRSADYPAAAFAPTGNAAISLCGRLHRGCSHFPAHGTVVLRGDAKDPNGPGASLFYGPHQAGHQSPAALHLDIHLAGRPVTEAPREHGYDKPTYLTWVRTTVAHNTVVVDENAMFPYDCESQAVFEADSWRDSLSDSQLVYFAPGRDFHAVRVVNDNVYPGVVLDRTVIVTAAYVLDVYRVTADRPRDLDYAVHCVGRIPAPAAATPIALGDRRGYHHLENAKSFTPTGPVTLDWDCAGAPQTTILLPPAGAEVTLADDFVPCQDRQFGELTDVPDRTCLLVRLPASQALFLSLWPTPSDKPPELILEQGNAATDLILRATAANAQQRFLVPAAPHKPKLLPTY